MKRKTLSNFIPPLYSDARTGQIVTTEAREPTGQPEEGASMKITISVTTTIGAEINYSLTTMEEVVEIVKTAILDGATDIKIHKEPSK